MIKRLIFAFFLLGALAATGASQASNPFETDSELAPRTRIDELVLAPLKRQSLAPAHICSDAVFLRRAYLDVLGRLPTADQAREFIHNPDPEKRTKLIDRLLASDAFAEYWAMKWGDLLRVKSEFPINLWPNAVQAYYRWIFTSIRDNLPYDRFVRELLTSSGSNFRVPPVNFYRAVQSRQPQAIAQAVALTFMGVRADRWPKDRLDGIGAFFSQIGFKSTQEWKEEIVFHDLSKGGAPPAGAVFPDGKPARIRENQDPRECFADWLIRPENPWFTRAIANRVWSWLLGRGIIHEPDDIRPDNPPANPELLSYLERELIGAKYDLKHLYRLILTSRTYQLSPVYENARPEAAAHFASYPLRLLDAEVLIDAIDDITGTSERYSSAIPEPYTFIPEDKRSVALPDASITSAFLEMFGRSPRDTGLESERSRRATAEQELHLLNSSHIQLKIQQSAKLRTLIQFAGNPRAQIDDLYLTVLSRFPTAEELKTATAYFQSTSGNKWPAVVDLVWALINSPEFLYRH
jgi:hypothetical protein